MHRFHHLKAFVLGVFVFAIFSVGGCGSGQDGERSDASAPVAENPRHINESEIIRGEGRIKGQNACDRATIRTGPKPGAIDFVAHCSGHKKDGVIFFLQSFSVKKPNERLGVLDYTQTPSVKGKGAVSSLGNCSIEQDIIACKALIDGPATLTGRFYIDPERRCAAVVYLTGKTTPPCRDDFCGGAPRFDELFRGRPRGCA
jgi:hypothetical protein